MSKQTPPSKKRRIENAENEIYAAAFNRKNTVCKEGWVALSLSMGHEHLFP